MKRRTAKRYSSTRFEDPATFQTNPPRATPFGTFYFGFRSHTRSPNTTTCTTQYHDFAPTPQTHLDVHTSEKARMRAPCVHMLPQCLSVVNNRRPKPNVHQAHIRDSSYQLSLCRLACKDKSGLLEQTRIYSFIVLLTIARAPQSVSRRLAR